MNAQTNLLQLARTAPADPAPVSRAEFESYWGGNGHLVIRQERGPLNEDAIVLFNQDCVAPLVAEPQRLSK